ncbi:hypothetical protein C8F01DRAFT_1177031 [Mycena amicta]|nr:hypothetical protein C8F01DRAFT_1177031 [Mycena amicta]
MFSCIYSTSPASPSTMPCPLYQLCSSSASSLASLDIPGAWKSAYSGRGGRSVRIRRRTGCPVSDSPLQNASSPLESPSASRLPSISSATPAFGSAASKSDSVAFATASSSALVSSAPFTEPECYYTSTSSETRLRASSISTISDRDSTSNLAVPVAHIQPTVASSPKSTFKAGIYGGRRGPTSCRVTSTSASKLDAADATTSLDTDQPLAPVPREMHLRVRVPSIRRHRTTSSKRVGRDMTFGGVIPRGRESSGLRIAVLMRVGMLADRRAKRLLEERAKEQERPEEMAKVTMRNMVMGGMLEMAREAEREERMELMGRKVQEVKRRRQGMEAVPASALARKTTKGQIQGGREGQEMDWVMV